MTALKVGSYTLTVMAADGGVPPRTGSLLVIIRVTDVTDDDLRFDNATYDVTVAENAPLLTVVTSVRATSGHRDANIRYSFGDETTRRYGQVCTLVRVFLSASLYFKVKEALIEIGCVVTSLVVGWLSRACTVAKRCILGL